MRMTKPQLEEAMMSKLCNDAKGHAQYVLLDKNMPDDQRQIEFEVIEEFVEYIRNYHTNRQKLQEYENWHERYIDDGR